MGPTRDRQDAITTGAVVRLFGGYHEAELLLDRACQEAANTMGLPTGHLLQLLDAGTIRAPQQIDTDLLLRRLARCAVLALNEQGGNYLKGRDGDCINAVLAAAGYNFTLFIKWFEALLRALITAVLRASFAPQIT